MVDAAPVMQSDAALGRRGLAPFVPLRQVSDQALVEQARAGSDLAFEALFDRHRRSLLAYCRRMLDSIEEAEDAVQLTFMAAYHDLMHAEQPTAWRPWLYGIARHRCLSALRLRRERAVENVPEPATDRSGAELVAREELRAVLADMALLADDQRIALVLAAFADLSHEAIAEVLGCRQQKVKALVFQARTSLAAQRTARETPCAEIREQLATLRGAGLRRSALRRHLTGCAACRAFADEMRAQRRLARVLLPATPTIGLKRGILGALFGSGGGGGSAIVAGALGTTGLAAVTLATVAIDRAPHAGAPAPSPSAGEVARVAGTPASAAPGYAALLPIALLREQATPVHDFAGRHGAGVSASASPADAPRAPARPAAAEPSAAAPDSVNTAPPAGAAAEDPNPSAGQPDGRHASGDKVVVPAPAVVQPPGRTAPGPAPPAAPATSAAPVAPATRPAASVHATPPAATNHDAPAGLSGPPATPAAQGRPDRPGPEARAPAAKPEAPPPATNAPQSPAKPDARPRPEPNARSRPEGNAPLSPSKPDAPQRPEANAPSRPQANAPQRPEPNAPQSPPKPDASPRQEPNTPPSPTKPDPPSTSTAAPKPDSRRPSPEPSGQPAPSGSSGQAPAGPPHPGH
jgi:RNA polymerase sigma factor (sigma-70 family)